MKRVKDGTCIADILKGGLLHWMRLHNLVPEAWKENDCHADSVLLGEVGRSISEQENQVCSKYIKGVNET